MIRQDTTTGWGWLTGAGQSRPRTGGSALKYGATWGPHHPTAVVRAGIFCIYHAIYSAVWSPVGACILHTYPL